MKSHNLNQYLNFGVKPVTIIMAETWSLSSRCHDLGSMGFEEVPAAVK